MTATVLVLEAILGAMAGLTLTQEWPNFGGVGVKELQHYRLENHLTKRRLVHLNSPSPLEGEGWDVPII